MHGKIVVDVSDIEAARKAITSINGCISGNSLAARPTQHIFVQFCSDGTLFVSLLGCALSELNVLLSALEGVLVRCADG